MLNRLNVWAKNGNLQHYPDNYRVPVFFPVKWQIDWSFDSGNPTTPTVFPTSAKIDFIFAWHATTEGGRFTSDLEGKIFQKTLSDVHNSSGCDYELNVFSLQTLSIQLEAPIGDQPFTASGRIQFIADHFHWGNILRDMEAISAFQGKVTKVLPHYYLDAEFKYNVTMLES